MERELDELFVLEGHISGSPLSETSTFLNTDLVSIGMFVATYTGVRALMRTGGQGLRMIERLFCRDERAAMRDDQRKMITARIESLREG